ncbi:unnamed protein product [Acanthosepion pharaonis]|uniref:Uncharacterized protein n=1 Tax=Acanthosepion pharaonis TaxID=158019 RepID=A0A812ECK5_ACAPH|nr:unnamed protein product [Sepia pharaonis]
MAKDPAEARIYPFNRLRPGESALEVVTDLWCKSINLFFFLSFSSSVFLFLFLSLSLSLSLSYFILSFLRRFFSFSPAFSLLFIVCLLLSHLSFPFILTFPSILTPHWFSLFSPRLLSSFLFLSLVVLFSLCLKLSITCSNSSPSYSFIFLSFFLSLFYSFCPSYFRSLSFSHICFLFFLPHCTFLTHFLSILRVSFSLSLYVLFSSNISLCLFLYLFFYLWSNFSLLLLLLLLSLTFSFFLIINLHTCIAFSHSLFLLIYPTRIHSFFFLLVSLSISSSFSILFPIYLSPHSLSLSHSL